MALKIGIIFLSAAVFHNLQIQIQAIIKAYNLIIKNFKRSIDNFNQLTANLQFKPLTDEKSY